MRKSIVQELESAAAHYSIGATFWVRLFQAATQAKLSSQLNLHHSSTINALSKTCVLEQCLSDCAKEVWKMTVPFMLRDQPSLFRTICNMSKKLMPIQHYSKSSSISALIIFFQHQNGSVYYLMRKNMQTSLARPTLALPSKHFSKTINSLARVPRDRAFSSKWICFPHTFFTLDN